MHHEDCGIDQSLVTGMKKTAGTLATFKPTESSQCLDYNQIQILVTVYWPAGTAISVSRTASEKQTPATPIVQSPIIR